MFDNVFENKELEMLTAKEQAEFELEKLYWEELLSFAKADRATVHGEGQTMSWDTQSVIGSRIKSNSFPMKPLGAAPD